VDPDLLNRLISALNDAFLFQNERYVAARDEALERYRAKPYRELASAGQSYPADPDELVSFLNSHAASAQRRSEKPSIQIRGVVSPHIDYARGRTVYAAVWTRAQEAIRAAELVIILGTDHFGSDGGVTLTRQNYATPFDILPTSQDAVEMLAEAIGQADAFAEELNHQAEHSIELAAIWMHYRRDGNPCELLPVLCGSFGSSTPNSETGKQGAFQSMLPALITVAQRQNTVVVAAGDLSHVGPAFGGRPVDLSERVNVQTADGQLIHHITTGDAAGFLQSIQHVEDRYQVCGASPIYAALRTLSPATGELVAYDCCPADESRTSFVSICGVVLH
jgi:hypothetical protein